ncbi:MAG: hypothetical protein NTX01_04330 [Candidatus Omnitrophica bacterium]|nr:hypothetical protein [Candidatus Omnitrophota bacterium]
MQTDKNVKKLGILFIILSIPASFLALIASISSPNNFKEPLDVLIDITMRILFIGTPIILVVSAIGLLKQKEWGRIGAICVSGILLFVCLAYGILGLKYKSNIGFCITCLFLVILFAAIISYLMKVKKIQQK